LTRREADGETRMRLLCVAGLCVLAMTAARVWAEDATGAGATHIAKWKGDKQAAFLLMFDDSAPSHVKNVVPQLKKRGLVGTFYVNPGKGGWPAFREAWEKEFPAAGMVYANHTMTHKGARDAADLEQEIVQCNEVILRVFPGRNPRLISFGIPGVPQGAWNVTNDELSQVLAKHHLVLRPPFDGHGAMIHAKTADDMMRLADRALAQGSLEYIIYHGVGGDWIVTPLPEFTAFLDKLAAKRDQLWITDPVSAHKYETERSTAAVRTLETGQKQVRVAVTTKADPQLYDLPLTLITPVPAAWKTCTIAQGGGTATVPVSAGLVRYEALPGGDPVTITPAAGK